MSKLLSFLLLFTGILFTGYGQQNSNQTNDEQLLRRANELYNQQKYNAARALFEDYIAKNADKNSVAQAEYLRTLCAIDAGHDDAQVIAENYIASNPAQRPAIYRSLGLYQFNKGSYDKAATYFVESGLANSDEEVIFKSGYAFYKTDKEADALRQFKKLKDGKTEFAASANYYAGFLLFNQFKYSEALPYFNKIAEDASYGTKVKPLLATIYFKQGDDKMLVAIANELKENSPNAAQIFTLTGEMFFKKKDYQQAITYFEKGSKNGRTKDPGLFYKIGYCYDQLSQVDKAIENYKQSALQKDSVGHYSAYRLGSLYQSAGNVPFALSSFYNASKLNAVPELQKDATYQYGKLSFEAGKFSEAIATLKKYSKDYPKDANVKEANELITKAYLQSSDYDLAIEYIESLASKSNQIKAAYQQVCYFKAVQLFNQSQFYPAVQMFKKSLSSPIDAELVSGAHFWTGEAYSIGKKYDEAIVAYKAAIGRKSTSNYGHKSQYGLAYALFNSKKYNEALPYFQRYLNNDGKNAMLMEYEQDAEIRLADCFYAEKMLDNAARQFRSVLQTNEKARDYATYQLGMVYLLSNNFAEAQKQFTDLMRLYPKSDYVDDAYFQSAQLDFESGNYKIAIEKFTQVIDNFGSSNLIPYALVRRATAYSNLNDTRKAEADYKTVVTKYPDHQLANGAILGLQEAMTANGNRGEFDTYLEAYKKANPQSTSIEALDFEAAKSYYFAQDYQKAISRLQPLVAKSTESAYYDEASYYIADSYFRLNEIPSALNAFEVLVKNPSNLYYTRSLTRLASLELSQGNPTAALKYFNLLKSSSRSARERNDAYLGLMEAHFMAKKYDSATFYAKQIVESGGGSFGVQGKANLYLGKAALEQGRLDDAMDHFINTTNLGKDENGAESQYLMAKILYQKKDYRQSLQTLYSLNNSYSNYPLWLGRSFLLIADNFIELKEYFQADATLTSLIEKSPIEEIKQAGIKKKNELQKLQTSGTNDSKVKKDSIK